MVETKTPHNYDQPEVEVAGLLRQVPSQALEVVLPELLHCVRVPIHPTIVVATKGACHAKEKRAVGAEKVPPGPIALRRIHGA
jgi:hypothetical protein